VRCHRTEPLTASRIDGGPNGLGSSALLLVAVVTACEFLRDDGGDDGEHEREHDEAEDVRAAFVVELELVFSPLVGFRRFLAAGFLGGPEVLRTDVDGGLYLAVVEVGFEDSHTRTVGVRGVIRYGRRGVFRGVHTDPSMSQRMDEKRREFLDALLDTASPSGYETPAQRVWVEYVEQFADEVHTDAYGNAVATYHGGDGPEFAFTGHADEIGYTVAKVNDDGYLHIAPIGGSDKSVSKGRHVVVHTDDGPVNGVIGQTAIHLRDPQENEYDDITEMTVDVGADDEDEARDLVSVGDPITVAESVHDLAGHKVAARGLDNRVGVWVAAEALRRASERGVDSTVHAVSTVQEEVGVQGAKMVGYDLHPDAAVAVDVTHASDSPEFPGNAHNEISLSDGPVVSRGSANHPNLVAATRDAADAEEIDVQLQAAGIRTGTDADAFYTSRGGIPSLNIGLPNRYMHTPAEVVDLRDLDAAADLLAALADREAGRDGFAVDL